MYRAVNLMTELIRHLLYFNRQKHGTDVSW
jgi:hypothetical protein